MARPRGGPEPEPTLSPLEETLQLIANRDRETLRLAIERALDRGATYDTFVEACGKVAAAAVAGHANVDVVEAAARILELALTAITAREALKAETDKIVNPFEQASRLLAQSGERAKQIVADYGPGTDALLPVEGGRGQKLTVTLPPGRAT